jgi:hypothetical protein
MFIYNELQGHMQNTFFSHSEMEQNNIIPTIKNMIKRTQNGRMGKEKWQEEEDFQPPELGTSHNTSYWDLSIE